MLGFFGKLFFGFIIVVAVLGAVGLWMRKREKGKGEAKDSFDETCENVADLNDHFIRARYQNENDQ